MIFSDEDIRNKDIKPENSGFFKKKRAPVSALLINVRSAYNVGSIFRTSDSACIEKLYLTGYTPTPPDLKIAKTALGAEEFVPWEYHPDPKELVLRLKADGYYIVAFETVNGSDNFFYFEFPENCVLLLGNEKDGISADILNLADSVVEVPAGGIKNSMNVAVLCGISLYEALRQYERRGSFYTSSL